MVKIWLLHWKMNIYSAHTKVWQTIADSGLGARSLHIHIRTNILVLQSSADCKLEIPS